MEQVDQVATLMGITDCSQLQATQILSMCDFDLEQAVNLFYVLKENGTLASLGNQGEQEPPQQQVPPPPAPAPEPEPEPAQKDPVQALMDLTECSEAEAVQALSACNFDVQEAANLVIAASRRDEGPPRPQQAPPPPRPQPLPQQVPPAPKPQRVNETLYKLPDYVNSSQTDFGAVCRYAVGKDRWILLAFRDDTFESYCLSRDFWWPMETILENSVVAHEVRISSEYGQSLVNSYGLNVHHCPELYLINPATRSMEEELTVEFNRNRAIDGQGITDQILQFIATRGNPTQFAQELVRDSDEDEQKDKKTEEKKEQREQEKEEEQVIPVDATSASEAPPVEKIDITPYQTAEDGMQLRFRTPTNPSLTLRLRRDTPVLLLLQYLAAEVQTSVERLELMNGFPPKALSRPDNERVVISDWDGVRSGDAIIVKLA